MAQRGFSVVGACRKNWRKPLKEFSGVLRGWVLRMQKLTLSLPCSPRRHSGNDQQKCQVWNHWGLSSPLHEHVNRVLSKCTVLKVDLFFMCRQLFFVCRQLFFVCRQLFFMCRQLFFVCRQLFFMCRQLFFVCRHCSLCVDSCSLCVDSCSLCVDSCFFNVLYLPFVFNVFNLI